MGLTVPAKYVHSTEWLHGDLGLVDFGGSSCVVALSNSGSTAETICAVKLLKERGVKICCVVGNPTNELADLADFVILAPNSSELLDKVPSASLTAQTVACNAIVAGCASLKKMSTVDFVKNHPGGNIGSPS